jgi:hypothetical protein
MIGKIFEITYPIEASEWCNTNNCYIEKIESKDGVRCFQVKDSKSLVTVKEDI